MSNVKGSNIVNRMKFVVERFGEDSWKQVLDALPEADAEALAPRVLSSAWYPFELYNRLDSTICAELAGGRLELCREMGVDSARRALSGTYRAYMKDGAAALLHRLGSLHRMFYDAGEMHVSTVSEGHCVIRNTYVPRSSRTNCLVAEGFYRTVVELCGGTEVRVNEARCSAGGAPICVYNVLWNQKPAAVARS